MKRVIMMMIMMIIVVIIICLFSTVAEKPFALFCKKHLILDCGARIQLTAICIHTQKVTPSVIHHF